MGRERGGEREWVVVEGGWSKKPYSTRQGKKNPKRI